MTADLLTCRCGEPIRRCEACAEHGDDPFKGWVHTTRIIVTTGLATHYCADGGMAFPGQRAAHKCAVCGHTTALRMLGDLWYCDDLDACYGRRHTGKPWNGIMEVKS